MTKHFTLSAMAKALLWLFIIFGIFARFYNLNWSQNSLLLHPDETLIVQSADSIRFFSNLDPKFYGYGGFTMFLLAGVKSILLLFIPGRFVSLPFLVIVGRYISATASCATIFYVFALAQALFKRRMISLMSTAWFTLSVGSVQAAHYYTTESFLVLFFVAYLFYGFRYSVSGKPASLIVSAIFFGLAVATKKTGILFAPFLGFFLVLRLLSHKKPGIFMRDCLIITGTSAFIFFLFDPFLFTSLKTFLAISMMDSRMLSGADKYPWTTQFNGGGLLFMAKNMFTAMGPVLPIVGVVGFGVLIIESFRRKRWEETVLWVGNIVFFIYVSSLFVKFYRYILPIVPFACIAAAFVLYKVFQKRRVIGYVIIGATAIGTFLWAVAFFSIYTTPHTNIQASDYLIAHVKLNERIMKESWNEMLPLHDIYNFALYGQTDDVDMYGLTNPYIVRNVAGVISGATYIVLGTQKNYDGIMHHADYLPYAQQYYRALFSGVLGFTLQKKFESKPRIGPFVIDDTFMEQTFWVFDHPTVYIFRNTGKLSADAIYTRIIHQ